MDKSMEMKHEVLEMLKSFMMGEQGKKIKPKAISVEMVTAKPVGKAGLKDVLDEASEDKAEFEGSPADKAKDAVMAKAAGMTPEEWEDSPEDEEADKVAVDEDDKEEIGKSRSLRDFFARK